MSLVIPSAQSGGPGLTVTEEVFGREFNEPLVHQLVVSYLAGARSGTKAQKTRSEVRGGGAKPWKQKGSGRARAGTTRGPLWRTGGVTFAAKPRNYEQKLNKKMYRAAMRSIFSELLRQGRLVISDDLSLAEPKTKALTDKLNGIGFQSGLIVTEGLDINLFLSARNIPNVYVSEARSLSPVELVHSEKVVVTTAALKAIEESLS
ncbi:MAG: 50S ribosomal protein L4 [Methylococcus sp.]|jgi:large subunit ribosomal protein L4